jgi:outer membrane protein
MRALLPASFLVAASLLGADTGAPASAAVPSPSPVTLSSAIDQALARNLGLAITRLDASRSLDYVEQAEAVFDPVFGWSNRLSGGKSALDRQLGNPAAQDFSSDVSLSRKFSWGGTLTLGTGSTRQWFDGGNVNSTASNFDLGTSLSYTQPLLAGAGRAVNLSALIGAKEGATRSRLALRAAALDLIRDTEVAYWSLAGARTLVALRETSLRSAESLLAQVRAKRALGDATALEELQAAADVANQKVAVLNAKQSVDGAEMRLRRTLGRGDATEIEQAITVDAIPVTAVAGPEPFAQWIRQAAAFDFDTAIQLSAVTQANASLAAARQNDAPQLDLTLGGANYGPAVAGFHQAYDGLRDSAGWSNSISLTYRLPLGSRESEAALRSAARAHRQAELRLADVRQSLVFNARATWRDLEAARARVDSATSALALQRQSYEGERARYAAGQSDILRVLQAQAALDSAQLNWIQSLLDARTASARVARLDGSLLARHGFTLESAEAKVGAGVPLEDPLPPLSATP